MLGWRTPDRAANSHPPADGGNVAKGDAGLRHPEGAWVHPHENRLLGRMSESGEVFQVGAPGVLQRVVDVGHRRGESQGACFGGQSGGDLLQVLQPVRGGGGGLRRAFHHFYDSLVGSGSSGVASTLRSGSHSSQLGKYQLKSPTSRMAAGTKTTRTSVASRKIATPRPKPSC